jgi:hypothetical protein
MAIIDGCYHHDQGTSISFFFWIVEGFVCFFNDDLVNEDEINELEVEGGKKNIT